MDELRKKLLTHIADLWNGDYSNTYFDGRDGSGWIMTAINGTEAELKQLKQLEERLNEVDRCYE